MTWDDLLASRPELTEFKVPSVNKDFFTGEKKPSPPPAPNTTGEWWPAKSMTHTMLMLVMLIFHVPRRLWDVLRAAVQVEGFQPLQWPTYNWLKHQIRTRFPRPTL